MDGKTVVIGALVALAVLLGGLVASGLRQEGTAYAQGGVYATYLVTTVQVADNLDNFAVLDSETRRLIFYRVDIAKNELDLAGGRDLARDFPRKP